MKKAIYAITIIAVSLFCAVILWQISRSRTFQLFGEIYPRVATSEKVVALTFDDGPTIKTDEILSILEDLNVKATFLWLAQTWKRISL